RAPWLLCSLVGGLTAALFMQLIGLNAQVVAILVLFLPLVLTLSESAALQELALATVHKWRSPNGRRERLRSVGTAALPGFVLGGGLAVFAVLGASLFGASWRVAFCVASGVAGGMAAAAAAGLAAPMILRRYQLEHRVASGPLARTASLL